MRDARHGPRPRPRPRGDRACDVPTGGGVSLESLLSRESRRVVRRTELRDRCPRGRGRTLGIGAVHQERMYGDRPDVAEDAAHSFHDFTPCNRLDCPGDLGAVTQPWHTKTSTSRCCCWQTRRPPGNLPHIGSAPPAANAPRMADLRSTLRRYLDMDHSTSLTLLLRNTFRTIPELVGCVRRSASAGMTLVTPPRSSAQR